ncbi:MAG: pilus assembly PilX family protein [Steroidobacteraceae bacterium]
MRPQISRAASQRGMALISALLLLLVVTIMAVSMFHSYGMQEKIAGNTREKQRALNAAVSAQQYAEWWLSSGAATPTIACGAGLVSASLAQVCNNPPVDFASVPWASGVQLTPFTANPIGTQFNTISNGLPTGAGATASYFAVPAFFITDLGLLSGGSGEVYQIDAMGYGGTPNAVAVVESTYLISTNTAKSPDK